MEIRDTLSWQRCLLSLINIEMLDFQQRRQAAESFMNYFLDRVTFLSCELSGQKVADRLNTLFVE